jgi:hypothetical protein
VGAVTTILRKPISSRTGADNGRQQVQDPSMSTVSAVVLRLGRVTSVVLLIATVYGAALVIAGFLVPMYESMTVSSSGAVEHGSSTLVDVNGLGVVVILAVPLFVTLAVGCALWQRPRRGAVASAVAWTLSGLLGVFSLLAMLSIGVFVLPITAALIVACAYFPSGTRSLIAS